MNGDLLWRLLLAPVLIGANAFFVAVEFALTRLPALDLDDRQLEESPGLRRAVGMLDRLEIHLTGCQLGISTTSVLLGVLSEPAVTRLIEPVVGLVGIGGPSVSAISVGISVVLLNLAHKVWGEQAPTYLGVERPREVAERLAPVLYWWSRVMKPVIKLGDGAAKWTLRLFGVEITRSWAAEEVGEGEVGKGEAGGGGGGAPPGDRADLKRRLAELLASGRVPEDRQEEVMASLEIDEIPARRIMVPAADMVSLALDISGDEIRRRIARSGHVRFPVLRHDGVDGDAIAVEAVAGVIYLPALFDPPERLRSADFSLDDVLEEPVLCAADLPVARLIDRLQEARQETALLVRDDRVVGLATITDALESIAGELEDPLDSEEA